MHIGAGRLGWAAKRVQALAAELVEGLSGLGRPTDAATVAATHLHDFDTAVHLFSQAHEWRQVCLGLHEGDCSPDASLGKVGRSLPGNRCYAAKEVCPCGVTGGVLGVPGGA